MEEIVNSYTKDAILGTNPTFDNIKDHVKL